MNKDLLETVIKCILIFLIGFEVAFFVDRYVM